jgi:hypothetical protein
MHVVQTASIANVGLGADFDGIDRLVLPCSLFVVLSRMLSIACFYDSEMIWQHNDGTGRCFYVSAIDYSTASTWPQVCFSVRKQRANTVLCCFVCCHVLYLLCSCLIDARFTATTLWWLSWAATSCEPCVRWRLYRSSSVRSSSSSFFLFFFCFITI